MSTCTAGTLAPSAHYSHGCNYGSIHPVVPAAVPSMVTVTALYCQMSVLSGWLAYSEKWGWGLCCCRSEGRAWWTTLSSGPWGRSTWQALEVPLDVTRHPGGSLPAEAGVLSSHACGTPPWDGTRGPAKWCQASLLEHFQSCRQINYLRSGF